MIFPRLHALIVNRILGLNDTPHRIAWGVFLGSLITFTPTVGVQMPLYVGLATVFRANKVSGIVPTWITNPVTAVPIYYAAWRVGAWVLGTDQDPDQGRRIIDRLLGTSESWAWGRVVEASFWSEIGTTLWALGAELWLGGLLLGLALAIVAYPLTYLSVRGYRRARGH